MTEEQAPIPLEEKPAKKQPAPSKAFKAFQSAVEAESALEQKIRLALDFMRASLTGERVVFRDFWQAQRLCLALFKENLAAPLRTTLWNEYIQLAQEVRRLKEVADEQSSFAEEQIDLALKAVEEDLASAEQKLAQIAPVEFPANSAVLAENSEFFRTTQQRIELFGQLGARLQQLRKEILKSPLRAPVKQKLLARLDQVGNTVFPERKALIQKLSESFAQAVKGFIDMNFGAQRSKQPFYVMKDEIRALQAASKMLTVSSQIFHETRQSLSECWDQIKVKEEQAKKVRLEKRAQAEKTEKVEKEEPKRPERPAPPPSALPQLQEEIEALENREEDVESTAAALLQKIHADKGLSKIDKLMLSCRVEELVDRSFEKSEPEDLAAFVLQMKARVKQIKDALELHRKVAGGSNLNFAESMLYQELIEREKNRLDQLDALRYTLEEKLYERQR